MGQPSSFLDDPLAKWKLYRKVRDAVAAQPEGCISIDTGHQTGYSELEPCREIR